MTIFIPIKALIENAPYNEKELLERLAGGDEAAFTLLFNSYKDKLYAFVLYLSGSGATAEDVLQETFLKIWQNRSEMMKINNFNAYLFRMAQNRALNALRRHSLEALIIQKLRHQLPATANPGESVPGREVQELLHKVLEQLPPQQRRVFELSRNHELKYEEIAAEMNISASTVRNHMVQALKTIRQFLQSSGLAAAMYFSLT